MAEIVRMPKLSDTMTEGVVAEWHKEVGEEVKAGDLLAEIETDKATMEFESFQDGYLLYQGVDAGDAAPVDGVLAILGEKGEDYSEILESEKNKEPEQVEASEEKEQSVSENNQKVNKQTSANSQKQSQPAHQESASTTKSGRIKASPLAKKMAEEKGISLNRVQGSGDNGRIVKRDIESFSGNGLAATNGQVQGEESYEEIPVSQMRKTIARRLGESKFQAPHFYLTVSINMDALFQGRKNVNQAIEPDKVSVNDFIIKAAAHALIEHPEVNSSWQGDTIRINHHVHMGVAVAVAEGLVVPVVRFANTKGLKQISSEVRELATKAKDKKLKPEDFSGNTFTISNLGMFGIEEFTAIINPPDACILAVGTVKEVPTLVDGELNMKKEMKVTLSCDHRVVDGAMGARFLQTFKNYMETPLLLTV